MQFIGQHLIYIEEGKSTPRDGNNNKIAKYTLLSLPLYLVEQLKSILPKLQINGLKNAYDNQK